MGMIQNVCSEIKWLFHDDQISTERMNEYNEMHLDQDPNFMAVRNVILTAFPDFTWETHCNHERCETTALVTWRGIYKGYNDEYGNNSFKIRISLARSISHWRNRRQQKDYGDVYVLKARFDRKDETLPSVVEKIKRDYDGVSIINNYYEDESTRIFKVSCADHRHIAEKNVKLENFIKAVCEYRSRLANKFVNEDKAARLKYANAQNEIDIETMEMKEELEAIAKKYFFELVVENRGNTRAFILTLRYGNCIIVEANTQHAWVNIHTTDITDGYALRYIRAKFGEMENKRFPLGDKSVIKIAEMLCNTYVIMAMAGTELVLSMNKFKNETPAESI